MYPIATITSEDGEEFVVNSGISDILIDALICASGADDEALKKFTGDPGRFSDIPRTKAWIDEEGRRVYVLTPKTDKNVLAGFSWMRTDTEKYILDAISNSEYEGRYRALQGRGIHTIAARLYGEYRGKRLANPFMQEVQRDYSQSVTGDVAAILAYIHRDNIPSQKLFARLGYVLVGFQGDRTLWMQDMMLGK